MPGSVTTGKKLDLSKLTDEEAKHVWEVVQRDFNLRKKEEDRLGELKTKIEKEDTKRELLHQTPLTESYCIRCLKPFKFLVINKVQCLDCALSVCKSCSHYSKKEQGWVCHPCHMTRVLKIGTLEWYHENVRARFKRFGSAKVMRSLFKRLNGEPSGSESELRGPSDYDTRSMPDTGGFEDNSIDQSDGQHYKEMKKPKRRLTVDPIELGLGFDYLSESRGRYYQAHSPSYSVSEMGKRMNDNNGLDYSQGVESAISPHQDELVYSEASAPSRSVSRLSYSSCGSGSAGGPRSSRFLPGAEDSEEDEHFHTFSLYQSHLYRHNSQESLQSNNPQQITDLNRRMSAVESLLNRLEQKVTSTPDQLSLQTQTPSSVSPVPDWEVELEEQQLRQKLSEMTNNISDHSLSDEDEEEEENQTSRPLSSLDIPAWRSPLQGDAFISRIPTRPSSRLSSVSMGVKTEENAQQQGEEAKIPQFSDSLDRKSASLRGSTALLFELEDKVAQAAADVQNTQSQVSYIENKIAALNAAGMPIDKRRKSAIPVQTRRLSQNYPTKAGHDSGLIRRRLSVI
ncbi:melanophilin isoform X2 [Periophthalmus magnuspinnatus]|uniref:melanophilin isoform X2 n=1 Tax=Periophthalmus magnuspinnatus TaxID=409849 RepID=UPI002437025B|nr:melanophilin isoform X2 [Periophthalmus magnuspinnatus]